ncbi:type II toxin-antitoxin system HicB family antitoxin [Motilimonas cestriensis]|uniref:type II toxin-antitoxin system HicB family antitoxin n=1 Tax=Motilimonas cestriensis TaxID=2742685 RepID=UPI003DA573AC
MSVKKALTYKTYCGSYEVDFDEGILFGKIECINDLVTFEAESVPELKVAFEEAVDDYLETCAQLNKDPDKPFKGSFNVRVGEGLHKRAYIESVKRGVSLNDLC